VITAEHVENSLKALCPQVSLVQLISSRTPIRPVVWLLTWPTVKL
jgi:hypothetical protein